MGIKNAIRRRLYKTPQEKIFDKWWADGGDVKLRFDYDLGPDSVVLDCGGYEGQWASDIFGRYSCKIFVFEPVRKFAGDIDARFRKNDKIQVFKFGLGGSSRKETINLSADCSSVIKAASEKEEIEIVDVAEWLKQEKITALDLMKINIEGGEYELLERLIDIGFIGSVKNIQVQFHDFVDNAAERMEKIQARLMKTHTPTYKYRFVWENWTRKV